MKELCYENLESIKEEYGNEFYSWYVRDGFDDDFIHLFAIWDDLYSLGEIEGTYDEALLYHLTSEFTKNK